MITHAAAIQPGTGTFKITSVARAAGPSILRRNVPEARWPPRPRLSVETTDVPSTALAAQRSTWSLGILSVCAFAIRIHDMAPLSDPLLLAPAFPNRDMRPRTRPV